ILGLDAERSVPRYARGAIRIGRMLAGMAQATIEERASAEMVLWAGWAAALNDVGSVWEEQELGDDKDVAARANRDMESVEALSEAAERYVVQFPRQTAARFTEYLAEQD